MGRYAGILSISLFIFLNFNDVLNAAAEERKPHPHLYINGETLDNVRQQILRTDAPEYAAIANGIIASAKSLAARDIIIFERQGAWTHFYICDGKGDGNDDPNDGCGGSLLYEEDKPYSHLCPRCGKVYRGDPYDQAWVTYYNHSLARYIRTLGLAYLLSNDEAYAHKSAGLCVQYAQLYLTYPLRGTFGVNVAGAAHLFTQTIDEATWIFEFLWGLDAIYDSPALTDEQRTLIETQLLRPMAQTIGKDNWGPSNLQAWMSGAVAAIGFFLQDEAIITQGVDGPLGYYSLMNKIFGPDGFSVEGSIGYHYYAATPLMYLARIGRINGRELWNEPLSRVLTSTLSLMEPDASFPRYNDTGPVSLRGYTSLYEIANGLSDDPMYNQVLTFLYRDQALSRGSHYALFSGGDYTMDMGSQFQQTTPPSIGIEALRGSGENPLMLFVDRGPHGGVHGHDDKLNLVLYGQGRELMPDLGSGSLVDGLLDGWLRRTISHNTVITGEYGQNANVTEFSPLSAKFPDFGGMKALSATAVSGVYDRYVQVSRTALKVRDDYALVLDDIQKVKTAPIDIVWHGIGSFGTPTNARPTALLEQWKNNLRGYQYLKAPRFISVNDSVMEIIPAQAPVSVTWQVPLSLSDNMEDITLWYGGAAQSSFCVEGKNSMRFFALPGRYTSIGKDITHPRMDPFMPDRLEFDYYLDSDKTRDFSLSIQNGGTKQRRYFAIPDLRPKQWLHASIDLTQPSSSQSVSEIRSRLEFMLYNKGAQEDSFFVYIDNVKAYKNNQPVPPLMTGLGAQIVTDRPAKHILAEGPSLRTGETHGILITRFEDQNALAATLLEPYADAPQWRLTALNTGLFRIDNGNVSNFIEVLPDKKSYSLLCTREDKPERLVLLNRDNYLGEQIKVMSQTPMNLELTMEETSSNEIWIQYQSQGDEFWLQSPLLKRYPEIVPDITNQTSTHAIIREDYMTLSLPAGTHIIRLRQPAATRVEDWRMY